MNDVRDILELRNADPNLTPTTSKKKKHNPDQPFKRPEGMHRELYALLCADGGKNFELAPLLPTDTPGGYKRKANLGAKKVRPWKWTPFTNPARKDGAVLYHWRRVGEENKEYPFAKFNKENPIVKYSESEYSNHLEREGWTKEETDHLFDLARLFELRFTVMQDRYNRIKFPNRSVEDIKDRYYQVTGILTKLRAEPGQETKSYIFDVDHERKRKEQLNKLWSRTPEQVEEEEFLRSEMKKIEIRKKEREKKTQDLQKLITAADGGGPPPPDQAKKVAENIKKSGVNVSKKKSSAKSIALAPEAVLIKWADPKNPGATTRQSRVKLPGSVGQRRAKAVESKLIEYAVDAHPFVDEEIGSIFCELRSNIVLNYEYNSLISTCNMEIQSLKHQFEAAKPGEVLEVPPALLDGSTDQTMKVEPSTSTAVSTPATPDAAGIVLQKKRKAAIEQGNILKKLKNKM